MSASVGGGIASTSYTFGGFARDPAERATGTRPASVNNTNPGTRAIEATHGKQSRAV